MSQSKFVPNIGFKMYNFTLKIKPSFVKNTNKIIINIVNIKKSNDNKKKKRMNDHLNVLKLAKTDGDKFVIFSFFLFIACQQVQKSNQNFAKIKLQFEKQNKTICPKTNLFSKYFTWKVIELNVSFVKKLFSAFSVDEQTREQLVTELFYILQTRKS